MKKKRVILSFILVHHCFASYIRRIQNTAHIVYNLYQCVAVNSTTIDGCIQVRSCPLDSM